MSIVHRGTLSYELAVGEASFPCIQCDCRLACIGVEKCRRLLCCGHSKLEDKYCYLKQV